MILALQHLVERTLLVIASPGTNAAGMCAVCTLIGSPPASRTRFSTKTGDRDRQQKCVRDPVSASTTILRQHAGCGRQS